MDEIVNKVAQSSLMVFDLEDYYPDNHGRFRYFAMVIRRIYLKESDFRTQLKNTDWSNFEDKYVALYCSTDAILPAWAFALVTVHLAPHALKLFTEIKS